MTVVGEVTALVAMVKLCDSLAPAGTSTVAGTEATAGLELDSITLVPPDGAAPFICTWLEGTEAPPVTELAERVTAVGDAGLTISVAALVIPL